MALFEINLFELKNEPILNMLFLLKLMLIFIPLISFNKFINSKKQLAARIQNEFDCEVLEIKCSNKVKSVSNIKVAKYYLEYRKNRERKYKNESWDEKIINWYSEGYSQNPIDKGRIHCQSTNVYYDKDLRDKFNKIMYLIIIGISFVSIITCLIFNWKFRKSIIHFFFPVAPIIVFLYNHLKITMKHQKY